MKRHALSRALGRCLGGLFQGILVGVISSSLHGATAEQTLAAMDACREQVINSLSFPDKMALRSAMDAIQGNPDLLAANRAVANAPSAEARVTERKKLAALKLDLLVRQNPSLKPVVEKIRAAQSKVLQ